MLNLEWNYLTGIRKHGLVGVSVALLEAPTLPLMPGDPDVELSAPLQHHVCLCPTMHSTMKITN